MTTTNNNNNSGSGFGLFFLCFIVFLVLKLTHTVDWSWWWVTAPLWGYLALSLLGWLIGVLFVTGVLTVAGLFTALVAVLAFIVSWPVQAWERSQNRKIAQRYAERDKPALDLTKPKR